MSPTSYYYFAPLVAVLCWSGNIITTKLSAGQIEPASIAFYRWLVAILCMTPFVFPLVIENKIEIRQHLMKLAFLGFLGMALYQGIAYLSAKTTTATSMGIITSLIPLVTLGLSSILLKEVPAVGTLVGGLISLLGITILIGRGHPGSLLSQGVSSGDGLMLIASISYAFYSVLLRRWAIPIPLWQSMYIQACFGALFLFPLFLISPSSPLNQENLSMILYAAVAGSIIAPYFWMVGIKHLGPNRTSIFMNLLPVMTACIAIVILKESLRYFHIIGGLITIVGIAVSQLPKKLNRIG